MLTSKCHVCAKISLKNIFIYICLLYPQKIKLNTDISLMKKHALLSRIIIFVRDTDLLKNFYADNFNLPVVEYIPNEWVVLNAGATEIALHKIGDAYLNDDTPKTSNVKLVFKINEDINAFRQQLLNNGAVMKDMKSFAGINSLFCDGEDPEGNIFQLEMQTD